MAKDLVTYQICKKLKEKGYPLLKVIVQDSNPFIYDLPPEHPDWQNCDAYYIPTIYQVLKWLREKKNLHIQIEPAYFSKIKLWKIYIVDINDYEKYSIGKEYISYEEAVLSGIEYVLDNNLI